MEALQFGRFISFSSYHAIRLHEKEVRVVRVELVLLELGGGVGHSWLATAGCEMLFIGKLFCAW